MEEKKKISEYNKSYYQKNKDRIKEKKELNNEIINCKCGVSYLQSHSNRHFKTKKHKRHVKQREVLGGFQVILD